MADTILTLQQIENLFQNMTTVILGLDPSLPANQDKVRIAWPTTGSPAWKIKDDIAFIRVTQEDNSIARHQDILYKPNDNLSAVKEIGYTRVHKVDWTLYGPNSYNNADLIRYSIFSSDYTEQLKANNLFLITDISLPVRLPELYNGQWWNRTDFSATFNELVVRRTSVPYITDINWQIIKDN